MSESKSTKFWISICILLILLFTCVKFSIRSMYDKFDSNRNEVASNVKCPDTDDWRDLMFTFEGNDYTLGKFTIHDFCESSKFDIDLNEELKPKHQKYIEFKRDTWNDRCNFLLKIKNNNESSKCIGDCTVTGIYCYTWSSRNYKSTIPEVGFPNSIVLGKIDTRYPEEIYKGSDLTYVTSVNEKTFRIESVRIEVAE